MTTIDIDDFIGNTTKAPRIGLLRRWVAAWRTRRTQRLTLAELGRMEAYHLRDMGIEPQDVIDALEGRDRSLLFNPLRRGD